MESQRISGKLKSPEITILSNWSQTSCRKLSNTSIQLGSSLGGLKQKQNKILRLVISAKMFSSCCRSLTALKEAVLIAIRTPPPSLSDRSLLNIVKPEYNISELLIFWFNLVSLTHISSEFSAYSRSWKRWRLLVCCAVFLITSQGN